MTNVVVPIRQFVEYASTDRTAAAFAGAHGDVYNDGIGRLIWQVIEPAPTAR